MSVTHQGTIAKKALKTSGYTLCSIAQKLGMSRTTLYKRFKEVELSSIFLFKLGKVIHHDFTVDFPALKNDASYIRLKKSEQSVEHRYDKQMVVLQTKYYKILEDYNKLLKFLVRIINDNGLYSLKKKMDAFIETDVE